jgi:hypothetical protein
MKTFLLLAVGSVITAGKNINDKVKAIALETVWVLEVILCWAVALPVVLIAFIGITLSEKAAKMGPTQSRLSSQLTWHGVGPDVEITRQRPHFKFLLDS